jgi:hypothetical protein
MISLPDPRAGMNQASSGTPSCVRNVTSSYSRPCSDGECGTGDRGGELNLSATHSALRLVLETRSHVFAGVAATTADAVTSIACDASFTIMSSLSSPPSVLTDRTAASWRCRVPSPVECGGSRVDRVSGERGDGSVVEQGAVPYDGELGDLSVPPKLRGAGDGASNQLRVSTGETAADDGEQSPAGAA